MDQRVAILFLIPGITILLLALPAALEGRSWGRFLIALPLSMFGVVLPLAVFLLSGFLVPAWKGGCSNGWIDCFYLGKLALTPFVLWATAALYRVEIYRVAAPLDTWVGPGLFMGAVVSSVCILFGIATTGLHEIHDGGAMRRWLLVPAYVCVWYWVRTAQYAGANGGWANCWKALCGSLPFWGLAVLWSRHTYASLPDQMPSCFVVTAAARGHRGLVGPFAEVIHRGRRLPANRQLLTLWQFEALWRTRSPRSHSLFRRAYNRAGPVIARRINCPLLADAVYLAIKPVELAAALALKLNSEPREIKP